MRSVFGVVLVCLLCASTSLAASSIVVSNDEWISANGKFSIDNDTQFIDNVASFLGNGAYGNILIVGGTFQSDLQSQLAGLGYTISTASSLPASLAGYNEVFLAGQNGNDSTELTNFVNGGGGVYIEAGTGCCGGAGGEAGYWNPFLNNFGLNLASSYNNITGDINVSAFQSQGPYGSALFSGVNTVFIDNGNNVSIQGLGAGAQVFSNNGNGLYGAWSAVPEPSSVLLLGSGLVGLVGLARRKTQQLKP